jgi:ubiquinone/menaquinone biosynthesis C-methylase UbiE
VNTTESSSHSSSSLESELKRRAETYDQLSTAYHHARFDNDFGRFDLQEGRQLVRQLAEQLMRGRGNDWRALDVACGTGKVALPLAALGGQVVALDAAPGMLEQVKASASREGAKLDLVQGSADAIPYPDGTFDMVFSFRFLHLFAAEHHVRLITEMARVAKPGGYVVLEFTNSRYGLVWAYLQRKLQAHRGRTEFSTAYSLSGVRSLADQIPGLKFRAAYGLLLPKAWRIASAPFLTRCARALARTPLKFVSRFLVVVYQKS